MSKQFHLGDVISVAVDCCVSTSGIEGYRELLEFMSNDQLFDHQLPRVHMECKPYLLDQFPWFGSGEMQFAVSELKLMLKNTSSEDRKYLVLGWLSKIACGNYGNHYLPLRGDARDMLEVDKLPNDVHERIDPESEMVEKFHSNRIIKL